MLVVVVVVYNGVREMLKYALRVPFCIALPLYCVHGQISIDKSRIRNFWSTAGGAGGRNPPAPFLMFLCRFFIFLIYLTSSSTISIVLVLFNYYTFKV